MTRTQPILLCLLALLFLTGCTKEVPVPDGKNDGNLVVMKIPMTRSNENLEKQIDQARVIIFTLFGGEEKFYSNEVIPNPDEIYTKEVPAGMLSVYLIANELASWNLGAIGASSSSADLKGQIATYAAYPVVNASNLIPMFGAYEKMTIDGSGNTSIAGHPVDLSSASGTVSRIFSKVSLTINCTFTDLPDNTPITLESVVIKQMPTKSYLGAAAYEETGATAFFDGATVSAVSGGNYLPTSTGFSAEFGFYVPEYLINDVAKGSYILVNACMTSRPSTKFRYKIMLGDGMSQGIDYMFRNGVTKADLTVTRNTHYMVGINKIKGFGDVDAMEIYAEAKPWEGVDVHADVQGRKLNVSHLTMEASELWTRRIHFWGNQPVTLEPTAQLKKTVYAARGGGATVTHETVNLEDYFVDLSGSNTSNYHFTWNGSDQTGNGYMDLRGKQYDGPGSYEFSMWLNAGGLRRQVKVTVTMPYATNELTYVNTFHRKDEVGERVIYLWNKPGMTWNVTIAAETEDFIRLSTTKSADPNFWTDNPGDPEDYPVLDGVHGTITGTGNVYFRVGVEGTTANNRYGIIYLSAFSSYGYSTNSRIFVRQGEDPVVLTTEVNAAVWSPYNVNDPNTLTRYPSQAGKYYQWGRDVGYNPVDPIGPTWDDIPIPNAAGFVNACPAGYRYPTYDRGTQTGEITEIRSGYYMFGCCADGFYDRRNNYNIVGAINPNSNDVAFPGIVFYYPNAYVASSMFMPFAGSRGPSGERYPTYGLNAYYWTSESYVNSSSVFDAIFFRMSTSTLTPSYAAPGAAANAGMMLRCVKE